MTQPNTSTLVEPHPIVTNNNGAYTDDYDDDPEYNQQLDLARDEAAKAKQDSSQHCSVPAKKCMFLFL